MEQTVTQKIFLKTIRLYQILISPLLGRRCRFYPSCSEYSILAIKEHGAFRGMVLSCWRILRCGPWSKGGVDLP